MEYFYQEQIKEALLMGDNKKAAELDTELNIRRQALVDALNEYSAKSELPERLKRKKVE